MKTMQLYCNKVSFACDESLLHLNASQRVVSFPPASPLGTFELWVLVFFPFQLMPDIIALDLN